MTPLGITPLDTDSQDRANASADAVGELLALERAALERWCRGDPSGFIEICAPDVVYFDPFLDHRIDGREALAAYYENLRGTISAARWELVAPLVQQNGDMAVLTFHFVGYGSSGGCQRWNSTEVYRRAAGAWQLIQSHWSFTRSQPV